MQVKIRDIKVSRALRDSDEMVKVDGLEVLIGFGKNSWDQMGLNGGLTIGEAEQLAWELSNAAKELREAI